MSNDEQPRPVAGSSADGDAQSSNGQKGSSRAYRRESYEPEELKNPLPKWFSLFSVGFIIWGASYFFMQGTVPADAGDLRTALPAPGSLPVDGATVYTANCVACHQANGQGLAGAFPPLDGSEWVLTDARIPAQILVHGVQGEMIVMGNTYSGVMPAMAHLSDEELAAVLNYIRTSWSNSASTVDATYFASMRDEFGERGPWEGGAELRSVLGEPDVPSPN
ncbi:MAG: c-type cytochrome [Granulosicoccus sp.]